MKKSELKPDPQNRRILLYGYAIVAISLCILILHYGARISFGIFFKPMLENFEWTRALASGSLTLSMLAQGSGAIIMGRLNDRFGPRVVMTICGLLLGSGFLLMSQVNSLWQLYLFHGIVLGIGMGGAFVALVSTVARWFVRLRGLMTGVTISGIGIGTLIISPVATWLISLYDWRTSYLILGGVILVISVLLSQFLKRDPSRAGLTPYHDNRQTGPAISPEQGFSFQQAVHTGQLWMTVIIFFSLGYVIMALNAHLVPHITDLGFSPGLASSVFAVSGAALAVGCIIIGTVADKIGSRLACMIGFFLTAVTLFWLTQIQTASLLFLFAAIYGLGSGGVTPLESTLTAELFGIKSHGSILGLVSAGFTIGGAAGPLVTGYLFDVNGNYNAAFLVCAAAGMVGLALLAVLKPLKEKIPGVIGSK